MSTQPPAEHQYRVNVALGSLLIGAATIGMMSLLLPVPEPGDLSASNILLDRGSTLYPFTIQNVMWMIFFLGLGELWLRFAAGRAEMLLLSWALLPEDDTAMLRASDLPPIYKKVVHHPASRDRFLPRLIRRVILQFQNSRSIDQANSLLNSSLELIQHEIDLRYNLLRYIMWLIPTLGFIGTVVGIAMALSYAGANIPTELTDSALVKVWVVELTGKLGLAFNTTLIALLMAAVLVFLMHISQGREESALNTAGQYCVDNLINRLYED